MIGARLKRKLATVFVLPSPPAPPAIEIVPPARVVAQPGIFFAKIGKWRRSVYEQYDGTLILADECRCVVDWSRFTAVTRSASCPIDQHRAQVRKR